MRSAWIVPFLMPLPVMAFTAENGMTAVRTGPAEITVLHDARSDDADYWCAAGDFVQRAFDLPGSTPLWRASPKPRGAGQGLVFTLDPAQQAKGAGLSQFGRGTRDGSVSAAMATGSFCRRVIPLFD